MKSVALLSFAVATLAGMSTAAQATTSKEIPEGTFRFIDFENASSGTPVNGLTFGGVTFSFGNNRGSMGPIITDMFPGTANTGGKGIFGPTYGLLGMTFARPINNLDFGFALEGRNFVGDGSVRDGVIVSFFDEDGEFMGSSSADAFADDERGGGAEYRSGRFTSGNTKVGSVIVEFPQEQMPVPDLVNRSSSPIDFFFLDNINFNVVIPLPTPGLLVAAGLAAVAGIRRRRSML